MKKAVFRGISLVGIAIMLLGLIATGWDYGHLDLDKLAGKLQVMPASSPEPTLDLNVTTKAKTTAKTTTRPPPSKQLMKTEKLTNTPIVAAPKMDRVEITHLKYPWDKSSFQSDNGSYWSAQNQLRPRMVPSNVHFIWCRPDRWFEFKHYLTVVSVARAIKPDKMVLHYEYPPEMDKNLYNQWLLNLKHDYPFFMMAEMDEEEATYCHQDHVARIHSVMQMLNAEGGIFVSENAWLLEYPPLKRMADFEMALDPTDSEGYILMRAGVWNTSVFTTYEDVMRSKELKTKHSMCSRVQHLYNGLLKPKCMVVKGGSFDRFWPMEIWEVDDRFAKICRRLYYGTEEVQKPQPSYDTLVPNIGHMVWIGGGRMDFVFYLSLLSMLYVAEVETVYIHGDKEPKGEYWLKVKTENVTRNRVKFIIRPPPASIYQGEVQPYYKALMSDLIRVDLMIKYGGLYTDTDAIWVQKLSDKDRGYDAVACFDWVDWSWPYPDSVNFGVSYGKKNAPFWQIFRDSMRTLHNTHHGFTGVMMPYKLMEKYPNMLRIDKHLSVICYHSKCHPIYVDDYHNMSKDHTNMGYLQNWKEDVHAFHWTHPNPAAYKNMTTLLNSTGLFADIGKYVLRKAGIL